MVAINVALMIAAAFALVAVWKPAWLGGISARTAMRVLSIFVFVRFAVPVFVSAQISCSIRSSRRSSKSQTTR